MFWILAATYFVGSLVYLLFGTGKLQEWNSSEGMIKKPLPDAELVEKEPLNKQIV